MEVTLEGPLLRAGDDMLIDWLMLVIERLSTEALSLSSSSKSKPSA